MRDKEHRVQGLGHVGGACKESGVGSRVSGVGCRVSGVGCRVSGVGRRDGGTLRRAVNGAPQVATTAARWPPRPPVTRPPQTTSPQALAQALAQAQTQAQTLVPSHPQRQRRQLEKAHEAPKQRKLKLPTCCVAASLAISCSRARACSSALGSDHTAMPLHSHASEHSRRTVGEGAKLLNQLTQI